MLVNYYLESFLKIRVMCSTAAAAINAASITIKKNNAAFIFFCWNYL
jgi:hypothetical protein